MEAEIKKVNNYMALIRNLRNLVKAGVSDKHLRKVAEAIRFEPAVKNSKMLPFRFWSAFKVLEEVSAPYFLIEALENALEISVNNLPKLEGRVMSLCDNSGSAHGTFTSNVGSVKVSEIANLTAALTAKTADEGHVGVFGDRLETFEVKGNQTVLGSAKKANDLAQNIGQGTETGIWTFWKEAIEKKEHWDTVAVYSDLQCGHGDLYASDGVPQEFRSTKGGSYRQNIDVAKLIAKYRETVNPDVQVYLCQVAGYDNTIVAEVYDKTYMLGGWSDGVIRYMAKMNKMAKLAK